MKKILFAFVLLFSLPALSQCSPFMGIGNVQFIDNVGNPLVNGVLYSFQAGTSTQQATFTSSTCGTPNVNPISFGSGGRVTIWLTTTLFYKFVLCAQNDGAACAAGDILFSVDQVPGGPASGGTSGSPFIGVFISGSSTPATAGATRFASGDLFGCIRNNANSGNLCWSKDTSDLLTWAGGSFKEPEGSAPSSVVGFDIIEADASVHRWQQCNNGASCDVLIGANTTDTLANKTENHPIISTGIANNGTGFQHVRQSFSCTVTTGTFDGCNLTINWPGTWADTNYTAACWMSQPNIPAWVAQAGVETTTTLPVSVFKINDGGAHTTLSGSVFCVGVHD